MSQLVPHFSSSMGTTVMYLYLDKYTIKHSGDPDPRVAQPEHPDQADPHPLDGHLVPERRSGG